VTSAAAVLRVVLSLFVPPPVPIELVDVPPPSTSENVEAFVDPTRHSICLVTSSATYLWARRIERPEVDRDPFLKIASMIAHEAWHVRHGPDERAAYEAQLTTLAMLGREAGTPLYDTVARAMRTVLKRQTSPTQLVMRLQR